MKAVTSEEEAPGGRIQAVLFDLDDTLISEHEYARSGYRAAAEELCREDPGVFGRDSGALREELWDLFRESPKQVFNRILLKYGLEDTRERVMALVKVYREHDPEIRYHEDVRPTLSGLRDLGIHCGILSDGYLVTQKKKIAALGAERDFEVIILTDELGREAWKPSPAGFRAAAEAFGTELSGLLYVGDNPEKDFYISAVSDVRTARITRPDGVYRDRPYREDVREQYTLRTLTDLLPILKQAMRGLL